MGNRLWWKGKTIKRKVETTEDKTTEIDFVDKTILSFDIGAGTTEEVVSHGVSFKHKMSRGLPYGVKRNFTWYYQGLELKQ